MHRDFATSPDWKTDTNHMYEQSCFGYSIMKVMVALASNRRYGTHR